MSRFGKQPSNPSLATFLWFHLVLVLALPLVAQEERVQSNSTRFHAVDVFVDSNAQPLAAYQVEFSVRNSKTKIVGIEGGEHAAFSAPPFYDPKAIQHERVILAAFNTGEAAKLPVGKIRVATLHLQTTGTGTPKFNLKLETTASVEGREIRATATVEERK